MTEVSPERDGNGLELGDVKHEYRQQRCQARKILGTSYENRDKWVQNKFEPHLIRQIADLSCHSEILRAPHQHLLSHCKFLRLKKPLSVPKL